MSKHVTEADLPPAALRELTPAELRELRRDRERVHRSLLLRVGDECIINLRNLASARWEDRDGARVLVLRTSDRREEILNDEPLTGQLVWRYLSRIAACPY